MENKIYTWLATPEFALGLCLLIPPARRWVMRMIEDSDGDPNHVDGFFVMVIWSASMCIRAAVFITVHDLYNNQSHVTYIAMFMAYSVILLGVRIFRSKFNLDQLTSKD